MSEKIGIDKSIDSVQYLCHITADVKQQSLMFLCDEVCVLFLFCLMFDVSVGKGKTRAAGR